MGEYTALVLSSAIDNVKRFPDSASLVAYFGLAPSVRNSADVTHHGRITKKGDKLVRHMLVEAVHTHVRNAPHSRLSVPPARKGKERYLQGGSSYGIKDATHPVPDAQKRERVPAMSILSFFLFNQILKQRQNYEDFGTSFT